MNCTKRIWSLVLVTLLSSGCGLAPASNEGDETSNADDPMQGDSSSPEQQDTGHRAEADLRILLTDAPIDDVESVWVTLSQISVQSCSAVMGEGDDQSGQASQSNEDSVTPDDTGVSPMESDTDDSADQDQETEDMSSTDEESKEDEDTRDEEGDEGGDQSETGFEAPDSESEEGSADDAEDSTDEGQSSGAEDDCADGQWLTVIEGSQTIDLLTLRDGVTTELGVQSLAVGKYGQIRLIVESAELSIAGERVPVTIPSGSQSGLKLNGGFELIEGHETSLTIDFDAEKSLKERPNNGGWMMKPVIKMLSATVEAQVDDGTGTGSTGGE